MGQSEVLKLIDNMKFTTHHELCNSTNAISEHSITKALSKLIKHHEIVAFRISRHTLYFSIDFYEEIGN